MRQRSEIITIFAFMVCYGSFFLVVFQDLHSLITVPLLAILIAFQSSLQHEAMHGHPFRNQFLNDVLSWPSLNLAIPYLRFKDTHLAHHINANLTDPYDDPESNYVSHTTWSILCRYRRAILRLNGTLLGRLILGPTIGQVFFLLADGRAIISGDRRVLLGWVLHIPILVGVVVLVAASPTSFWQYIFAAYLGLSLLKIRTFVEHQAHEKIGPRTVVIEDRGPLALLFLNNNFHALHHMHPQVAWYALPDLYRQRKSRIHKHNHGYVFPNYWVVFRKYFLKAKEPIVHPLWKQNPK